MNENQLGRNIQHLRYINNERLDDLGHVLNCAKSTVKGYENGSREPDLEKLQQLAAHYNKTVDELLKADLTGLGKISVDFNSAEYITELLKIMLPLFSSRNAMQNLNFRKGYDLSQKLLNACSNAESVSPNMLVRTFEAFASASEESETPEALADLMWCIFILWSQIYDMNNSLSLQNKLLSKKLSLKELMSLRDTTDASTKEERANFIADFDEPINKVLKILKSDLNWSDLADYYLALRYIVGMVDTDLSTEMNTAIGIEMMLSFMKMGNIYAFNLFQTCLSA